MSLLLCFVMVLGLLPTVSFAEVSGSGTSEDDPIIVSTFEELKSALETTTSVSMTYIKVPEGTVINEVLRPSEYDAAIRVHGFKTLIVEGSVTVVGGHGDDIAIVDGLLNLNGNACWLDLKGSGELTFKGTGSGATNSVVRVENKATLNVSGNLTLSGSFNLE